jgi:hypothetical protein
MLGTLTAIGSLILASLGFIVGRFYAESERILSQKRTHYLEFLRVLPPLQDTMKDTTEEEFLNTLRPAMNYVPGLMFYADKKVMIAWNVLYRKYLEANDSLSFDSPALDPAYTGLAKAQNDLIMEMRRDAFQWSVFNHTGKSRVPENLDHFET